MRSISPPLIALLACLLPLPARTTEPPDLSGSWVLNQGLSESLRQKVRDTSVARGDAGPRADLRRERLEVRERHAMTRAPFSEIVVESTPDRVRIRYRDGSSRDVHTDGRELGADPANGVTAARARWQDAALVIESDTARGQRIERWQLGEDATRLFVTIELNAGDALGRIDFTRVYDPQPAAPDSPDAAGDEPSSDDDG